MRAMAIMGKMRNAKTSQFGSRNDKNLRESTAPRLGTRLSGSLHQQKEDGQVNEQDAPKDSISINRDRLGGSLFSKRQKIGVSSMVLSQNSQIMATMQSV